MFRPNWIKIFAGVLAIVLVTLACGPTASKSTSVPVPTEPVVVPTKPGSVPVKEAAKGSGELNSEQKSRLAHATVRIWGVAKRNGKLTPIYHGSGTILTPDGVILTNCHVADPVAMGYDADKFSIDQLVVDMVDTEDKPPVPTYVAKVIARDPVLDLAVIQVSTNLDGSRINKTNLKLPWVPMGSSDNVKFGDRVYVFGYPAIGGDTITYSTGDVSGFDQEDPVGERAWIKTEASISAGNSGGLAANTNGEIIGVPTQVGTSTATLVSDCRFLQDTNGDGQVDQNDQCVSTGGFINGIRPVDWALPLIQAARNGVAYVSPYDLPERQPAPQPTQPSQQPPNPVNPNQGMAFNFVGWASDVDQDNCPTNTVESFPSGITKFLSGFKYKNIPNGTKITYTWFLNGRDTATGSVNWVAKYTCFDFILDNKTETIPDGDYVLEIYYNNKTIGHVQTSVGGTVSGGGGQQQGGVTLMGKVTDANTGKAIAKVFVVALNPGVDPEAWRNNTNENDIFSSTQTDSQGKFQLADLLERGNTYGIVVGNKSLGYGVVTGTIEVTQTGEDTINLPIQLSK